MKELTYDAWSGDIAPDKLRVGAEIQVAGYPGELDGYVYEGTGPITKVKPTKEGGYIIFYDVDTTSGNSGSPISIV